MTAHHEIASDVAPEIGSDRAFGIVMSVAFGVIAAWPLLSGSGLRVWALVIALTLLLAALLRPRILRPLNRLWFRFGLFLHRLVSPVIMGLLFGAIAGTGLVMRLLGHDLLRLKLDREADTYWIRRENPPTSMERQF